MLERVDLIIKKLGISASQFADEISVQRSSVSHVLSGRNKPSLDFITKIINRYPEINAEWLISGRGKMYNIEAQLSIEEMSEADHAEKEQGRDYLSEDNASLKTAANAKLSDASVKKAGRSVSPSGHSSLEKIVFFYTDGHFREFIPD